MKVILAAPLRTVDGLCRSRDLSSNPSRYFWNGQATAAFLTSAVCIEVITGLHRVVFLEWPGYCCFPLCGLCKSSSRSLPRRTFNVPESDDSLPMRSVKNCTYLTV
jgi:hypothetical protein